MLKSIFIVCSFFISNVELFKRQNRIIYSTTLFSMKNRSEKTQELRRILSDDKLTIMPCCYDGITAKMVEAAGYFLYS
jgi:hypothetical protein